MKIENKVITLAQAKRLSDLGITASTEYMWVEFGVDCENEQDRFALCRLASTYERDNGLSFIIVGSCSEALQNYLEHKGDDNTASGCIYNAYGVSELQLMNGDFRGISISEANDTKGMFYREEVELNQEWHERWKHYSTYAEAFGAAVIRGIEKGYYEVQECNNKLNAA